MGIWPGWSSHGAAAEAGGWCLETRDKEENSVKLPSLSCRNVFKVDHQSLQHLNQILGAEVAPMGVWQWGKERGREAVRVNYQTMEPNSSGRIYAPLMNISLESLDFFQVPRKRLTEIFVHLIYLILFIFIFFWLYPKGNISFRTHFLLYICKYKFSANRHYLHVRILHKGSMLWIPGNKYVIKRGVDMVPRTKEDNPEKWQKP